MNEAIHDDPAKPPLRCRDCYYILNHLPAGNCPECGRPFDPRDLATVTRLPPFVWYVYWMPGFILGGVVGGMVWSLLILLNGFDWSSTAHAAWGQLRDLRSSASHDPFHYDIHIDGGIPRTGATIALGHRYLGVRRHRVGRILWWHEGVGFAFSDLCRTDPQQAFPHVLRYRLTPIAPGRCRLDIHVGGRWTSRWPPSVGRWWLRWVFGHVARTAENHLITYAAFMQGCKTSARLRR